MINELQWPPVPGVLLPGRAPSFDVLGSFFPAWLLCMGLALMLTAAVHWLLVRIRVPLAFPVLTYPSTTVLFTFALWLGFFR
jgi:hypothetical protein